MEEFISEALRAAGLQASRHVSESKWDGELRLTQELQSPVHPADRDHRALTRDRNGGLETKLGQFSLVCGTF